MSPSRAGKHKEFKMSDMVDPFGCLNLEQSSSDFGLSMRATSQVSGKRARKPTHESVLSQTIVAHDKCNGLLDACLKWQCRACGLVSQKADLQLSSQFRSFAKVRPSVCFVDIAD